MDLEVAGDFILMASTLMHIKVRMLLPREVDERGEEIDPRADLIKALLEYKKYKEVAEDLTFFESSQRKISFRGDFSEDAMESPPEFEILLKNISVFDLAKAFKRAIEGIKPQVVHEIKKINVSIDEQIQYILSRVLEKGEIHFLSLVHGMQEKIRIVITFVALLELTKMEKIGIKESPDFNDFVIYGISNG
jgi:segregation and condensation protein A